MILHFSNDFSTRSKSKTREPKIKTPPLGRAMARIETSPAKLKFLGMKSYFVRFLSVILSKYILTSKENSMLKIFSYDIGSNSLGWSYLHRPTEYNKEITGELIDCGVRIFLEAAQEGKPPKNADRRKYRLLRRVIQRRARRKEKLENILIKNDLLPEHVKDAKQRERCLNELGNPYTLRANALDNRLKPYELGRAILHIGQRRGFLSTKKNILGDLANNPDMIDLMDDQDDLEYLDESQQKEETAFKESITKLNEKIKDANARTLGEFLHFHLQDPNNHSRNRNHAHEDFLRTERKMYEDELALLFKKQKDHHSALTNQFIKEITDTIFFQRPLKLKKNRIGKCSLEKSRYRCALARLEAQRFRYMSFIGNIRYNGEFGKEEPLTQEQRKALHNLFEKNPKVTITKFRQAVGFNTRVKINYSTADFSKQAIGNTTACAIAKVFEDFDKQAIKSNSTACAIEKKWGNLSPAKQTALVEDLLTIRSKKALFNRLHSKWEFDRDLSLRLCTVTLDPKHSNLSLKAINKILPHLENGHTLSCAINQAKYEKKLDDNTKINDQKDSLDKLPLPPVLPNPIVNRGMSELRRVVNAMILEFGKPDLICIELARDIVQSKKSRNAIKKQNDRNAKMNDEAKSEYEVYASKHRLSPYANREQKLKYRLWKDQDYQCIYSNEKISINQLFSAEIEIDHIVPLSKSLDDSYMNKVVCFSNENRTKGQRTPIEAFGGNDQKWQDITHSLKEWSDDLTSKRKRFYMTKEQMNEHDFTKAQLVNSGYLAREAHKYLKQLGVEVLPTKGRAVSWLRAQWDLNRLISEDTTKNREDHRHHAIDACVIALTNRSLYQHLANNAEDVEQGRKTRYKAPDLSDHLKKTLTDKIDKLIISHQVMRKVKGALHKETGRGYNERLKIAYSRKRVDKDLSVKDIIDPIVKEQVLQHIQNHDGDVKKAFAETVFHKDGKTPIHRVRIISGSNLSPEKNAKTKLGIKRKGANNEIFRWMNYGNTHCVHVYQIQDKLNCKFITSWEAAQKTRGNRLQIPINIKENQNFLMTLYKNDTVRIAGELYRVQKLDLQSKRITVRKIREATIDNKETMLHKTVVKFVEEGMKKVRINVLGKIIAR